MDTLHDLLRRNSADDLRALVHGRTVVVGVGNSLRGDDGVGPAVIARIRDLCSALCLDAGPVPENYLGPIVRANPDAVLLVDAVDLGLAPGSWSILSRDDLAESGLTTHTVSLGTFIDFLKTQIQGEVYVLSVQPETLEFGAELSLAVGETVDQLAVFWQG
jgi:hydrogenase 3 maturation protease